MSGKCPGSGGGRSLGSGRVLGSARGSRSGGGTGLGPRSPRAADGTGCGRRLLLRPPSHNGPAGLLRLPSAPRGLSLRPRRLGGALLSGLLCVPLCLCLELPPRGSPRDRSLTGTDPGDPVTVTGSGQSPFFKTARLRTSASRLRRAEAREPGGGGRSFGGKSRGDCLALNRQPRATQGADLRRVFGRGLVLWERMSPLPGKRGKVRVCRDVCGRR